MAEHAAELQTVSTEFERRSRAILVADVAGYARLMERAETETHKRYRAIRVGLIDPVIIAQRGELIKNTGDGFVAVFESPSDALRCAVILQREIQVIERETPLAHRIGFRMGINWGPVIFDLDDVYGHGVNVAARLQVAAPSGGIVVSHALLHLAERPNGFDFEDLGELHLKNMSKTVHALSLILPGVDRSAPQGSYDREAGWAKVPTIAVLPFTNLSEHGESYFSEGLVEDIIASLANIRELLVVSRGSSLMLLDSDAGNKKVGEKLGVRYYLIGSVRRSRSEMRLTVELVDGADESVMWAEKYDASLDQIFSIQDDIVVNVVGEIASHIRQAEVQRALRKPPQNLNAYEHLLRGLDLFQKMDFESFLRAREHLRTACEYDESYATAYAYLAFWHIFNIAEGWSSDLETDANEIFRLSTCAIDRDANNVLGLAVQGHGKSMFLRDYDSALDLFDRALTISPNSSRAWILSSATYGFIGDARSGIERAEHAIRLSPIDQHAFFNFAVLAQNHYLIGSYSEAIRWSQRALNLNPRFGNAARVLAASKIAVGRAEEARRVAEHHKKILPQFSVSSYSRRCPFTEPLATIYVERLRAAGLPD